jgi:hypothetical protein
LPWLVIVAVPLAAAVAAGLYFYGKDSADSGAVRFELAKAGIGLFAVAIFGGAVAAAFRSLDERRQEARRIDEYRAATAVELWEAYHRIKAVRRLLLVAGFDQEARKLSAEQGAVFHARMETLNDAQLTLEKLNRNVSGQARVFEPHTKLIGGRLHKAESYVNQCIDAWEQRGRLVQEGMDLAELRASNKDQDPSHRDPYAHLRGFLGPARDELGLKWNVSRPVKEAADLIQALRFGGGRELRQKLAKRDAKAAGASRPEPEQTDADGQA